MSTRCHIIVEDPQYGDKTILYRHSDGYPEGPNGVLATLVPFVARFIKHRGFDACYMGAQIMCDQINQSREGMRAYYTDRLARAMFEHGDDHFLVESARESLDNLDNDFLGFGISSEIHGDIEFIYRVTPEGINVEDACGNVKTTPSEARAMFEGEIPERFKGEG
jgi:hypothetical protein